MILRSRHQLLRSLDPCQFDEIDKDGGQDNDGGGGSQAMAKVQILARRRIWKLVRLHDDPETMVS